MLEQQVQTGAAASPAANRNEVAALLTRLTQAVRTIKTSKIGQTSGNAALYELPCSRSPTRTAQPCAA
ncbi:hypothetical protein G6F32_017110 [Rhizopus arrhizus]|nr:hypothetical protein G6F32_017110 [Rhizopus arrhizus]